GCAMNRKSQSRRSFFVIHLCGASMAERKNVASNTPFCRIAVVALRDAISTITKNRITFFAPLLDERKMPFGMGLKHPAVVRFDLMRVVTEPINRLIRNVQLRALLTGIQDGARG